MMKYFYLNSGSEWMWRDGNRGVLHIPQSSMTLDVIIVLPLSRNAVDWAEDR